VGLQSRNVILLLSAFFIFYNIYKNNKAVL